MSWTPEQWAKRDKMRFDSANAKFAGHDKATKDAETRKQQTLEQNRKEQAKW